MRVILAALSITLCVSAFAFPPKGLNKDSLPSLFKKSYLVFPIVVHSPETNWGFGGLGAVFFKHRRSDTTTRTSDMSLVAVYTLKKQIILAINSTIFFSGENTILRFQNSFTYYPDHFWGLGNESPYSAKENYSQKQFFFNPQFLVRVHKKIYVGLSYEYQNTSAIDYTPNGIFDQQNITGRYGGNTSGIGPILTWDTRNSAYSPTNGIFAETRYVTFGKAIGSNFTFNLFNLDYRQFFSITNKSVLAVQLITGLGSGNVPFRKLEKLGGFDMMRGYYSGRFTDKCLMAYQAEWRQFLFWRLGIVGFVAIGQVSHTTDQFTLDGFHFAYGGGLRISLNKMEKLNLRLDYGIGKHSTAFNLQIREAF